MGWITKCLLNKTKQASSENEGSRKMFIFRCFVNMTAVRHYIFSMLKSFLAYCLVLASTSMVFAQSGNYYKVSGITVSQNSSQPIPYGTVMITRTKGYKCDSFGRFTLYDLSNGKYNLTFIASGYGKKDTTILINNADLNDLRLTVYTECSAYFNEAEAQKDIAQGKPKLLLSGGFAPTWFDGRTDFEKKYAVYYYDFGCISDPTECILAYNKTVFAYLDKKYGSEWRKEIQEKVIGLTK